MTEKRTPELSTEEHERGLRLVRRCDAFTHALLAVEGNTLLNERDKENAITELRSLSESAETALMRWQRDHGIRIPE
jgi:hypothetical protein